MSQVLTSSRMKAFRTCMRLHQYRYLECRVPHGESGAMRFGTLFHAALEQWWKGYTLTSTERLALAMGVIGFYAVFDEEERVIAEELMAGYHLRWHQEPLTTELVEHEFEMPLVNPMTNHPSRTWTLRGKIDALVTSQLDQRRYLVEHKTTTSDISEGSGYWQRLRMDGQVNVYYDAFEDVAGCIYDVIRRPGLRRLKATPEPARQYTKGKPCKLCKLWESEEPPEVPRERCPACGGSKFEVPPKLYAQQREHDETLNEFRLRVREAIAAEPESYYKRGVVVRLEREIHEARLDLWLQATQMREVIALGLHPRNPDACIQFNRICDYFDVCTGVASIEDERLFKIRDAHPELSKEATR